MLYILSTIIRVMTLTLLLDDYLRRNYPQKYETFLFTVSYNAINLYSKGQIILNKAISNIKSFIHSNPKLKKIIDNIYSKEKLPEIKHMLKLKKIIINKPFTFDYELTNFSFLLIEFVIGEKIYKINLKDKTYNFYIVDNIFDTDFFTYYLTTHYPEKILKKDIDITQNEICMVKIVDHNVKTFSVDMKKNSSIKLLKDGYVINMKKTEIIDDKQ